MVSSSRHMASRRTDSSRMGNSRMGNNLLVNRVMVNSLLANRAMNKDPTVNSRMDSKRTANNPQRLLRDNKHMVCS